jgi:hypothetical protein
MNRDTLVGEIMHFDDLVMVVWLGGIALQAVLAVVVLIRKVWRRFPAFAVYVSANLAFSCLLYLVAKAPPHRYTYFYLYWSTEFIVLILGLAVVFEIWAYPFAPYAALKKSVGLISICITLLLLVCGVIVILGRPHGEIGLSNFFFVAEEVVRLVEVGLVAFLFLCANLFSLHWRQPEFGIALGIGTYAIAALVMVSLREYFGHRAEYLLNIFIMLAFDFSLLIWIGYLYPRVEAVFLAPSNARLQKVT